MMLQFINRITMFGVILLAWGCATPTGSFQAYEGPQRADGEVVLVMVPSSLEILALEGKEVKVPYFGGNDYRLELLPGTHTLEVFYKESWGGPTSSGVVVSDVNMFRFHAEAGATYMLKHNGPRDLVTASRFSDMPKIWLIESASGRRLEPYATAKYVPALLRAIRKSGAGDQATTTVSEPQVSSIPSSTRHEDMQRDALKRLTFWWKVAGKKDREAFKQWLAAGAPTEVTGKDAHAMKRQQPSSTALAEDVVMQQDALERLKFWWGVAKETDQQAFKNWLDKGAPSE